MRLQLNDSAKTVITSIETTIERKGDFDEKKAEYFYYITINCLELRYYGANMHKLSQKDFNKLLSKGAKKEYKPYTFNEQEQGWMDGTAADCANPRLHGHVCYSILAGEMSGQFVWDYNLQKIVPKDELTPAPKF